jgi:predicted RNase H-like nuclease (RuvC/YqgF family)
MIDYTRWETWEKENNIEKEELYGRPKEEQNIMDKESKQHDSGINQSYEQIRIMQNSLNYINMRIEKYKNNSLRFEKDSFSELMYEKERLEKEIEWLKICIPNYNKEELIKNE